MGSSGMAMTDSSIHGGPAAGWRVADIGMTGLSRQQMVRAPYLDDMTHLVSPDTLDKNPVGLIWLQGTGVAN